MAESLEDLLDRYFAVFDEYPPTFHYPDPDALRQALLRAIDLEARIEPPTPPPGALF